MVLIKPKLCNKLNLLHNRLRNIKQKINFTNEPFWNISKSGLILMDALLRVY